LQKRLLENLTSSTILSTLISSFVSAASIAGQEEREPLSKLRVKSQRQWLCDGFDSRGQ